MFFILIFKLSIAIVNMNSTHIFSLFNIGHNDQRLKSITEICTKVIHTTPTNSHGSVCNKMIKFVKMTNQIIKFVKLDLTPPLTVIPFSTYKRKQKLVKMTNNIIEQSNHRN